MQQTIVTAEESTDSKVSMCDIHTRLEKLSAAAPLIHMAPKVQKVAPDPEHPLSVYHNKIVNAVHQIQKNAKIEGYQTSWKKKTNMFTNLSLKY